MKRYLITLVVAFAFACGCGFSEKSTSGDAPDESKPTTEATQKPAGAGTDDISGEDFLPSTNTPPDDASAKENDPFEVVQE